MVRKIGAFVVAAATGATLMSGLSHAGTTIASATQIEALETNKVQHQIDLGRHGLSVGDVFTVSTDLSTPDATTKIGHMQEVCPVMRTKHLALQCAGSAEFADGQVASTGRFPPRNDIETGIVTGGTGLYENVGGSVVATPTDTGTLLLTFSLVP